MRIFVENFSGFTKKGIKLPDVAHTFYDCTDYPAPTIMAGRAIQYFTISGANSMNEEKPTYRVPLMSEIRELPWNGFKVISTFAGGGGSSTGYRMAGFKIALANEFVPSAQDSYRANMDPSTILEMRGIQDVDVSDVLMKTGLNVGELDVFDGSPPCQAFSTAGKREKGWGDKKVYEHGAKQKNEELFFDYIRWLDGLKPKVFVAENVSGLVKGTAKGFFLEILAKLKACGYRVEARLLDAQWLGVPQARQRIIFLGVRDDLDLKPAFPKPLAYRYTVRDALPHLSSVNQQEKYNRPINVIDRPCLTIRASMDNFEVRKEVVSIKQQQVGHYNAQLSLDKPIPTICSSQAQQLILNELLPEARVATGNDAFEPRFGSLDNVSPTITASGARTSGLDETAGISGIERRKFTIDEVKRLCGFPDDFILKGTYAQQWERLGNSVPPVMMFYIAKTIRDEILIPYRNKVAGEPKHPRRSC